MMLPSAVSESCTPSRFFSCTMMPVDADVVDAGLRIAHHGEPAVMYLPASFS
jgi:hypothetical protein